MNKDIKKTLDERGKRYGDFKTHAEITQRLKKILWGHDGKLDPMHREALEMIFHKIGRILNGDPNHADSWHDIAGYAQLVVDRILKEKL
jgi:predicted transcriptional regulator